MMIIINILMLHKNHKGFLSGIQYIGLWLLEKVYENAIIIELKSMGINVEKQKPIKVYYKEQQVGEFYADL